jgi:hypothetical protein
MAFVVRYQGLYHWTSDDGTNGGLSASVSAPQNLLVYHARTRHKHIPDGRTFFLVLADASEHVSRRMPRVERSNRCPFVPSNH